MKRYKVYIVFLLFLMVEAAIATQVISKQMDVEVDVAQINDIRHQLSAKQADYAQIQADVMYFFNVIDKDGNLIFLGHEECAKTMREAWMKHAIVLELDTGNTIFIQDTSFLQQQNDQRQRYLFFYVFLSIQLLGFFFFIEWIQSRYFTPFKKLQYFAQHITDGNLDEPLYVDKYQSFGAFSESFDMMRVALKHAKAREESANESKKELVAKLSHDIKTPVATIKAISELMQVQSNKPKEKEQLSIILAKSDQIDTLISNLFHATLEELEQLQVQNTVQSSSQILCLFEQADYDCRVHINYMEDVLVAYDSLRLSQVIDNVISNAYKYANSDIDVSGRQKGNTFEIMIQDHGGGINEQDLVHIQEKFYRGQNVAHLSGSGLGLYIATYFMHEMKGELTIINKDNGLCILLLLLVSTN